MPAGYSLIRYVPTQLELHLIRKEYIMISNTHSSIKIYIYVSYIERIPDQSLLILNLLCHQLHSYEIISVYINFSKRN